MQKKSLFGGLKKQNVHEFCVFERYLLRKSVDFLNICIFFANFVSKIMNIKSLHYQHNLI